MSKRRARPSPFFKLPPELRTAVYDLVLAGPRTTLRLPLCRPPLLKVCSQITSEATSIFCSNDDFSVKLTAAVITTFSRCLKAFASGGKSIRRLVISLDIEQEAEMQRTSKYGGGGVINYPHWWWSEMPREITGTGIWPEVVIVVEPLAVAWTSDLASYADRWMEQMQDRLPGACSEH